MIVSIETIVALFKDTDSSRRVLKELYEVGFKNEFWVIGDTTEGWGNESAGTNPFNSSKSQYDGATSETEVLTRVGIAEDEAQARAARHLDQHRREDEGGEGDA